MPSACDRYITLKGGLTVPIEPCCLLLDLEARGVTVTKDGDDILVSPPGRITDDDRAGLRRWKPHVLALLAYEPDRIQ